MAHRWRMGPRRLAAWSTAALALGAADARALVLGEAEVRSALGEPLDLRIPVTIGAGESIEPGCFSLLPQPAAEILSLQGARVSVQRSASGTYLRIQSPIAIAEPALAMSLAASCPGQPGQYRREYTVLLDPRAGASAAPAPPAATGGGPSPISTVRAIAATLMARIGDTLESIANAIFPRNRAAKKSYIEALRETNPPLAALGDNDPIPLDTPVALPDLRTFARARPRHETEVAAAPAEPQPAAAPRAAPAPRPRRASAPPAPALERPEPQRTQAAESAVTARARAAPPSPHTAPGPGFVLKLSSPQIDMSRTRAIDERIRAELRDRQLVLDSDDQVAALLALRNSVRQLESKVAELQLKLSGMPSAFPPPRTVEKVVAPAPAPTTAEAPVAPPEPPVTKAEPPVTKVEPLVTKTEPLVTKTEPPRPESVPTAKVEPPPPAPTAAAKTPPRTVPAPPSTPIDWVRYSMWGAVLALFALAGLLAWRLARRNRETAGDEDFEPPEDEIVVAEEHTSEKEAVFEEEPFAEPEPARREIDSDADLATRLPGGNTEDLRRRYIDERFPEIANGAIVLDDPDSVVKGARLFYEDGAIARAVELLQYAIERDPTQLKSWLALFEIFRLERLAGEFAELARRFKQHHGRSEYWRKVQYFGREIDPGNTLYQEDPINTFETIGPSQAKRIAAEASFDPVAENWLGAPMDFENEVLANELRKTLMADAGINEQDMVPNPMPALRNVEMFTVA